MRRASIVLLMALFVCARVSAASPRAVAAQTPLQRAWHHFDVLEYDQALAVLADAKRVAHTPGELADTQLLEGFVQIALDRTDEGLSALRLALRQDLQRVPPANLSPKLMAVFEQARKLERDRAAARANARVRLVPPELPPVARRALDVTANVEGDFEGLTGSLVIEDRAQHESTTTPLVRDGKRWLAHMPASMARSSAKLLLRAELVSEGDVIASDPSAGGFALVLPDHDAALMVESPLTGAVVRVDGVTVGRIPLDHAVAVTAGERHIELTASQGVVRQTVFVSEGEVAQVTLQVQPRSPLPIVRWVLIGVGGALAITGGVLFSQASREMDHFNALVTHDPSTSLPTTSYASAAPTLHEAQAFRTAAIATVSVGGAVAVLGMALFALHAAPHDDAASHADTAPHGDNRLRRFAFMRDGMEVHF